MFGEEISKSPSSTALYTVTGKVEYIRFPSTFIAGSDTSSGRHGFELKLPSDYESNSSNPKAGTYPFINDQTINITSGSLQLIPTSYSTLYEMKPYYGGSGTKDSGTQIPVLDARDWYMDYFNGVFFQQDPPGTGDHAENPDYVEGYLYIGKYLSEVVASGSTSSATGSSYFTSPADGYINTTGSVTFAGGLGSNYVASSIGTDTFFFVSGTIGSKDSSTRGATVFGGDVIISGTLGGGSPLDIDSKVIVNTNRVNSENYDFIVFGADHAGREIITTHIPSNIVMFLSGGNGASPNEFDYSDMAFFVSGTVGSRNTSTRGTAVFGGDVVVSGSIYTKDGTIASRTKNAYFLSSDYSSGDAVPVGSDDFSSVSYNPNLIDILFNGMLLHSGSASQVSSSERDYYISGVSSLKFAFDVVIDDIIDVVVYKVT